MQSTSGSDRSENHPPPQEQPIQRQQCQDEPGSSAAEVDSDLRTIRVGNLESEMDEVYLRNCFAEVANVKIIRNKLTGDGESAGYGFVEFSSRAAAEKVLQSYHDCKMPGTEQSYCINWASYNITDTRQSSDTIFVWNLGPEVTSGDLQATFESVYQSVISAKVHIYYSTGDPKGYGFVKFGDANEMARALTEMNGKYCLSRPMQVNVATPMRSARYDGISNEAVHQAAIYEDDPTNTTIFVGGIGSETTNADLRQMFSPFGDVDNIRISNRNKGTAFVKFARRSEAEAALEGLKGTVIANRPVRLAWAWNQAYRQSISSNNSRGRARKDTKAKTRHLDSTGMTTISSMDQETGQSANIDRRSAEDSSNSTSNVNQVKKLLFRKMLVRVSDGRFFMGLFHCLDKQGNIILQNAVEYTRTRRSSLSPMQQRGMGLIFIPASCRTSCQVNCSIEEQISLLSLQKQNKLHHITT